MQTRKDKQIVPAQELNTEKQHDKKKKGRLEVICGPMFSGKSEELIRLLRRSQIARRSVVAFKHGIDTRHHVEYVTSHAGSKLQAIPVKNANKILELVTPETEVVGIDEAQFFSNDLIPVIFQLLEAGKRVIIAGLNLDHRGIPFGPMGTLIPIADKLEKLTAVCMLCGDDATLSQLLVNNKAASPDDLMILVGAEETYQARCRDCYVMGKVSVWQNQQ